ncbi:MAG: HD domain-containing protein [Candidatus Omnitrophica bacterium]|jgi:HAMP domain-containing protein|nr:HD domain-containing protein [Candidatus Omnitrophota bacterium]
MRYSHSLFGGFRTKVTIAFVLSLFLIASLSNFLIYKYSYNSRFMQLREELELVAQTAALSIDEDMLMRVPLNRAGYDSEEYRIIAEKLRKIKSADSQILFVYTMARTGDDNIWQFVVDPEPLARSKRKDASTSYPGDKYDVSRFPEMKKALQVPSADKKLVEDEWGVTISGYAPIRDSSGKTVAVIGIDMSAKKVRDMERELNRRAVFVLALGIFVAVILGLLIGKGTTDPIKKLEEATQRISSGDFKYRVDIRGNDEISRLGKAFNRMAESISESRKALQDYFYRIVQTLARSIEAKDTYTKGHSDRVAEYARKIALEMGIAEEEADMLKSVAELHDIGKLGIEESILNKDGKPTPEEWEIIKEHPKTGEEILTPVFLDKKKLAIVRSHHERYDGKGYPDGLKGDEIDILAQIVSVADSYDAMTSKRAYRDSMGKAAAIEELVKHSGTQFNPEVVEAFIRVLGRE